MQNSCDVLIIGAGIIGLAVARELRQRGVQRIVVLEKEDSLGRHASGRNSGVLHAGIYYSSDSLKARFCARGAEKMKAYAEAKSIPIFRSGKVLVASTPAERTALDAIYERARANGIRVEKINAERLAQIEPAARTRDWALYSPDTAVIDPHLILESLHQDLTASGVEILLSNPVLSIQDREKSVRTPGGDWSYGHLINAAGLYADRIAHQMNAGRPYRILPFRGRYRKLTAEASRKFNGLIYPVPDARLPFLGVHFTKSVSGDVWVGPTAEPALGRENYAGLEGVAWPEVPRLLADLFSMSLKNAGGLALHIQEEMKKKLPGGLISAAQRLVPGLRPVDFSPDTKTGVRAQLVDIRQMRLVMDFVVEKALASTHVLNAVSPGFTASLAFAEYVADAALG